MSKEETKPPETKPAEKPKGVTLFASGWPPRVVDASYTGPVRADGQVRHPVHGWCWVEAKK